MIVTCFIYVFYFYGRELIYVVLKLKSIKSCECRIFIYLAGLLVVVGLRVDLFSFYLGFGAGTFICEFYYIDMEIEV